MKNNIGKALYTLADKIAHKIPAPILSFFSMPVGYQMNSRDAFVYESTRMINLAFTFCMNNKIQGDYAEFGVYNGATSKEAYRASVHCGNSSIQFYAFDSFEGLPHVTEENESAVFSEGQFSCSRTQYEKNMKRAGADLSRFNIIEGFYDESLKNYAGAGKIAIAWIDCDLYESTVPVLEFLTNRLVNGSILIFDDWFCYDGSNTMGEQRACAEWLKKNPQISLKEYQKFHWAGISFIVNTNSK